MALVAMFAFNTTADAQLGGLLKKAKAAVSGKSSQLIEALFSGIIRNEIRDIEKDLEHIS